MEYAEIKTCNLCGHVKPYADEKVQYTNIHTSVTDAGIK